MALMRYPLLLCCFLFSLVLIAYEVAGQSASLSNLERYSKPGDPDKPTQITASVYIVDVLEIDDVDRTITADYFSFFRWNDPRLSDEAVENPNRKIELGIDDIWTPKITELNLRMSTPQSADLSIDSEGNVFLRQRSINTFTAPLNLKSFPFDQQVIKLRFLSTVYNKKQIDIVWDSERAGHPETFSLPGWRLKKVDPVLLEQTIGGSEHVRTGFDLDIHLERISSFYIWKVFVPLGFIAFMAWTVFWIDPANFQGQIAISSASVITLIAFQMSLSELLPPISYLTEIDIYALGTSFLVFLALGESTYTARLAKANRQDLGRAIDKWMRVIYPILYFAIILIAVL